MKLFFRKYGEGPPLIILHGLYGSSDNWATIAKSLGGTFTVYLPDQRNHGNSPHSEIHNYDAMRDDLYELAANLNLKKFFLAGHSMGGKTAISFALKWPEMLYGLLIADISPFVNETSVHSAHDQHLSILSAMQSVDISNIPSRRFAELYLEEKIPDEKIRGFILKNLGRNPDNKFSWKINVTGLLNNLERIMEGVGKKYFFTQPVTGFPVIFLKGADSDYILPSEYIDILKIFPAAEIIEVVNAGHWIHADRPDKVIESLKRLLENS